MSPSLRLAAILWASASSVSAGTIVYSNFGPGNSFNSGSVHIVGTNPNNPSTLWQSEKAVPFIPGVTATFTELDIAVANHRSPDQMTFLLASGDTEPTTVLEEFNLTGLSGTFASFVQLQSVLNPVLTAGARYWIVGTAGDLVHTDDNWASNDQSVLGFYYRNASTPDWTLSPGVPAPVFAVLGDAVAETPEPATVFGAAVGLAFLVWRRRQLE